MKAGFQHLHKVAGGNRWVQKVTKFGVDRTQVNSLRDSQVRQNDDVMYVYQLTYQYIDIYKFIIIYLDI